MNVLRRMVTTGYRDQPAGENPILFRCIKDFHLLLPEADIRIFTEGKEYQASYVTDDQALFLADDRGKDHLITKTGGLWKHFVDVEAKAEEVQIIEAFIKLCIESMTPHLFDILVDEIVPALEKYRHVTVRSVKELGKEMGVE